MAANNTTILVDGYNVPYALWLDPDSCTDKLCPPEWHQISYYPSLAGNSLYLAIFVILLVVQSFLGVRHKTWGFLAGMVGGLALEILGYISRIELHENLFSGTWFKM